MNRKEFLSQVGVGVSALLVPVCLGGLAGCSKSTGSTVSAPTGVDFTIDTSTGALSKNGGYLVQNGIIVARTKSGSFLAVSAACTHEGVTVMYDSTNNRFVCNAHDAVFSSTGSAVSGPANGALKQYNTSLSGATLRVYS